jgi:hypothetical protein
MRIEVPKDISEAIGQISKMGREAWRAGDITAAEESFLSAWKLIPDPKFDYDFFPQTMSRGLVEFYRDTAQFAKARAWLETVRQAYLPIDEASEATILFLEATVDYDSGELVSAFQRFETLYKLYKMRPFQGQDDRYKRFFSEGLKNGKK